MFVQILELINEVTSYNEKEISLDTSINLDLRIEGDDATDFIGKFAKKFSVDISAFDFDRYFITEGFNPMGYLNSLFKKKGKKEALTIKLLIDAIELKKLE